MVRCHKSKNIKTPLSEKENGVKEILEIIRRVRIP